MVDLAINKKILKENALRKIKREKILRELVEIRKHVNLKYEYNITIKNNRHTNINR